MQANHLFTYTYGIALDQHKETGKGIAGIRQDWTLQYTDICMAKITKCVVYTRSTPASLLIIYHHTILIADPSGAHIITELLSRGEHMREISTVISTGIDIKELCVWYVLL